MKIFLAALGGALAGIAGVYVWVVWYFRDVMK